MKKAIILAIVSCFLMSSVAFAMETSVSTSKSSYTEQMKKKTKKAKKGKKAAAPAPAAQ